MQKHDTTIVKSCNYDAHATKYVRHLLPESDVQTLVCSITVNSRLDYCNALIYEAPGMTKGAEQHRSRANSRVVLIPSRWLPVLRTYSIQDASGEAQGSY